LSEGPEVAGEAFGAHQLFARADGAPAPPRRRRDDLVREKELRATLISILEGMTDRFVAVDRDWRITYVNAAAESTQGRRREELLGKTYWEVFPGVLGSDFEPEMRRAMTDRVPARRETYAEGCDRWFEMDVHPIQDSGLAVYGRDITDRKHAEEALRRSEERFRRYFELGLIGMTITSPTKGCLEVNDKLCEILGYGRDELTRMNWVEITHPDDLAADAAQLDRVLAGEIDGYSLDKRWIRKDGQIVETTISVKCLRRRDGAVDYFVGLLQDVTERKRDLEARKALLASERQARAIAEESSRVKDEFLATLSHELRSPISSALLWLQVLRSKKFDGSSLENTVDAIDRSVRAQARLIDDLLDLSRIAAGKLRLELAPVNLSATVETAVNAVLPAAAAKKVPIRYRLPGERTFVNGDAARLQQVLSNLLTNAIKFTPTGGEVNVDLESSESWLKLTVSDTGEGMDSDLVPQVFERFRQGDTSATRKHGGLGLGLAIVRHLVESHGGSIKAKSEGPGQGATFVVSLPAMRNAPGLDRERPVAQLADMDLSGMYILLVDDDPSIRTALARLLDDCNARTDTASTADEAMARLSKYAPDLLISDISMPGTDGYEFIRRVRAAEPLRRLPAIALTAFTRPEDRIRALQAGYNMHLPKPVDPIELLTVITSLVR
jgi:PAS domain S-box-containing protein